MIYKIACFMGLRYRVSCLKNKALDKSELTNSSESYQNLINKNSQRHLLYMFFQ